MWEDASGRVLVTHTPFQPTDKARVVAAHRGAVDGGFAVVNRAPTTLIEHAPMEMVGEVWGTVDGCYLIEYSNVAW